MLLHSGFYRKTICLLIVAVLGQSLDAQPLAQLPAPSRGEIRGVYAVRGERELVAEGADQRLVPASLLKLVVAAASLNRFGAEYRFSTVVYAPAVASDGGVQRILVAAGGDPSWSEGLQAGDADRPLRRLAAQVYARGVRRIDGDLVVDTSRVVGRRTPPDWPSGDSSLGYGAAPSALAWRDNRSRVRIAPGPRVGAPAVLVAVDPIDWKNESITVGADRDGRGSIEFDLDWGASTATLRGEYPISERPFSLEVATPDPDQRAALALASALRAAGVAFEGNVVLKNKPQPTNGLSVVARFDSPPLREILVPLLSESNNFIAEMLLRNLAFEAGGVGRLDVGVDAALAFLVEQVGVDPAEVEIDDGSGLSPFNLLTPRSVVTLLRWAWQQPWRVEYFEAMASDQRGTVHDYWPKGPPMRAKTGTLRHTQCLAGVLLPKGVAVPAQTPGVVEEPLFFVWMINHSQRERRDVRREIMATLWNWSRL